MKTALITGASGQDAYYLSLLLLGKGYKVVATERRSARARPDSVMRLLRDENYSTVECDVTDISSIMRAIKDCGPDEFYHLAAQSEVGTSFSQPLTTIDITGMGSANCLEALRIIKPDTRFYFAGSSEQYGDTHGTILNEDSPFIPRSPYACAKLMGYHLTRTYRFSYDMFTCCGVLFNHESPERKHYFVTRKITDGVARINAGKQDKIRLGNILSGRDWGHALDYMEAAWMMLQADKPDDYVVATGKFHSIEQLLGIAFKVIGVNDWTPYVEHGTPENMRPHDVIHLVGDSTKIRTILGWEPKTSFEDLITEMVQHDIRLVGSSVSSS
ncbi:MAG: GDP-mannose 4,6-dehydratase [Candidatus Thorarchaeota archaeon]|jgi:GDPmannose 4,6-dehydratase